MFYFRSVTISNIYCKVKYPSQCGTVSLSSSGCLWFLGLLICFYSTVERDSAVLRRSEIPTNSPPPKKKINLLFLSGLVNSHCIILLLVKCFIRMIDMEVYNNGNLKIEWMFM
jgi:hypothetical protein